GEETPVLKTSRVYNRSINPESKLSSKSFVVLDREADRTIQDGSSDANQVIVSSDQSFLNPLAERSSTEETFPLLWQDRFLNTSKQDLTAPAIVDGCNVYRNEKTRYFVDVYYAPELANRSLKGNDAISNTYAQERAQSEKPIMSYSAGVRGSMVFANGLSLRAGLSYSNNTERFDFVKERQTITREIKDKDGNVIRTEIEELVILDKMYNHYKYFDLPILIGYERDLKDFILSLNSGLAFNLSADQSGKIYKPDIKTVYELERSGEANESIFRNNAGVSFIASVGLNYKYNERMMLLLEPSARYYLRSLSDASNPVSQKYLFLGMNIGVRYRIQ
ncbi:MAG TPA: hypothetical protein VFX48_08230, partial [Saprospiraceae bacterium]|nr:hypothetical protein [Saprospiraceae bacterium]